MKESNGEGEIKRSVKTDPHQSPDDIFDLIYRSYVDDMYSYGYHMGFDKEIIKDAIHDIFLMLLSKRLNPGTIRDIKSYLLRTLYNRLIDQWRTENFRSNTIGNVMTFILDQDEGDGQEEDRDYAVKLANGLNSLIDKLPYNHRSAVYFRYLCGMSYGEIAGILGCTQNAARKFVFKGLMNMRKHKKELELWLS